MKTNIWLKSQPNKKIQYPDCYPCMFEDINGVLDTIEIHIFNTTKRMNDAMFNIKAIARVEFRP